MWRVTCYAGEILEVMISVVSARHVNTGEESGAHGITFRILSYGTPIYSVSNVRSHTWRTSANDDMILHVELFNESNDYEIVVRISTRTSLIQDANLTSLMILLLPITLGVFVLLGIRRFQKRKCGTIAKRSGIEERALEPTSHVTVPRTHILRSRIISLRKGIRKQIVATDSDEVERAHDDEILTSES
jgi:hypothetical protein